MHPPPQSHLPPIAAPADWARRPWEPSPGGPVSACGLVSGWQGVDRQAVSARGRGRRRGTTLQHGGAHRTRQWEHGHSRAGHSLAQSFIHSFIPPLHPATPPAVCRARDVLPFPPPQSEGGGALPVPAQVPPHPFALQTPSARLGQGGSRRRRLHSRRITEVGHRLCLAGGSRGRGEESVHPTRGQPWEGGGRALPGPCRAAPPQACPAPRWAVACTHRGGAYPPGAWGWRPSVGVWETLAQEAGPGGLGPSVLAGGSGRPHGAPCRPPRATTPAGPQQPGA